MRFIKIIPANPYDEEVYANIDKITDFFDNRNAFSRGLHPAKITRIRMLIGKELRTYETCESPESFDARIREANE